MSWQPCAANQTLEGLVWLPRLLQKARRSEEMGSRIFDGYCYGENDFIDGRVLRFLNVSDANVCESVRQTHDDAQVARILIQQSGRSRAECEAFSTSLRRKLLNFAFLDADEGRMPPGPKRSAWVFFYNKCMMPIAYAMFSRAEQKRRA